MKMSDFMSRINSKPSFNKKIKIEKTMTDLLESEGIILEVALGPTHSHMW